jgi:serine/threonine-protein kinase
MPLATGTRIGAYEVVELLGAGGMGEVYRARDPRLNRDVALKILPEHLTDDPERLARFQREAQVLAALAHANIAHIYAIEEAPATAGGTRALVLELVEGPTLADRIEQGPVPADEAIAIAKQIAEALDAAHEQGIVHRDLKPANIKLREDGTVKVLDFGLAKLGADASDASSLGGTLSPTLSVAFTGAGTILGTAAYMAPEQARGKRVDKRADVWAFGCVLFEMLARARAFDGTDATEMIAAVVRGEPGWAALPAETPPRVVSLLRRCLQKDPRQRLRDIGDARYELEHANATVAAAAETSIRPSRRITVAWAAGAAALAVAAGAGAWLLKPLPERAIRVFEMPLPAGQQFSFPGRHMIAISPQGHVAYTAENRIYLRRRDELSASVVVELAGLGLAAAPRNPFFSPDGEWLGFWAAGELRKVALTGGAPVKLTSAENPWGVWWDPDGTILYGQGPDGIYRVSENGGTGEQIIKVTSPESAHGPQLLPDGRTVLFTLAPQLVGAWNKARIVAQSLDSGTRTEILAGGTDARYLPTGHLVYSLDGSLLAVPFDASRLTRTGGPIALISDLAQTNVGQTGAAQFSLSPDGTLAYIAAADEMTGAASRSLSWFDRKGSGTPLNVPPRAYRYLEISNDETRVVFDSLDPNRDVFILSLATGGITPLTFESAVEQAPIWTHDDQHVIYASSRDGPPNIYRRASNGSGTEERLLTSKNAQLPQAVTRDGSQLIFLEIPTTGNDDLMIMNLDGDRKPQPLIVTNFRERNAALSPNGRWLAYQSDKSTREEVWVTPFPYSPANGEWKVSEAGGTRPRWLSDGELAYVEETSAQLMSVAVHESGRAVVVGPPVVILNRVDPVTLFSAGRTFDVSNDGRRILTPTAVSSSTGRDAEPRARVILIQHWIEDLKRRVPSQ